MDDYLKIEVVDGCLRVEALKEITEADFAPVASEGEGCAISFLTLICDESPWSYKSGEMTHTATLKVAFCYAPQLKAKIDELTNGVIPQLQFAYLMDLFKVYTVVVEQPVKGKDKERAKAKAMEELKAVTEGKSKELYAKAVESFRKALVMLKEI